MLFGRLGLKNERLDCCFNKRSPYLHNCHLVFLHHRLGYVVRWLIALVLILSLHSTGKDLCSVREFWSIAHTIHNPSERHQQLSMWLTNNARFCRSQDFVVIWNNLSEWVGTADSSEIRAKVIQGYKDALEREKK